MKCLNKTFFLGLMACSAFLSSAFSQTTEMNPDMGNAGRSIRVDALFEPSTDLDQGGSFEFYQARLVAPLYGKKLGENWILAARMKYEYSVLEMSEDVLSQDNLHRLEMGPMLIYKAKDSPWSGILAANVGLATDWSEVSEDDIVLSVLSSVGYRFTDKFTLLVGAYYSQDFGDARLFPGIGFLWKISPEWTVNLTPPRLRISYAPGDLWRFVAEAYPDGGSWSVEASNGEQASLQRKTLRTGVRVERRITETGFAYLGGGWAMGRELRLEAQSSGKLLYESDAANGAYFSAGLNFQF
ncbi:hypothetical protein BH11VER1_BH11VER1_10500 [soil metagenome]